MVNYSNGKIYKIEPIVDHEEGDIYVGSTTKQYLSQRMDTHRRHFNCWKNGKLNKISCFDLFEKFGVENCHIILIELVNAASKDELLAREAHHIKTLNCVNKNIPLRTGAEYYQENKEKILEKVKLYQHNNKDIIKIKKHDYVIKHKEEIYAHHKEHYENNKENILNHCREYREKNKEKIRQIKSQKYVCECGQTYTHSHKSRHMKTNKHLEFIKNII